MQDKNHNQPEHTIQNFPVVGVGASAGGFDAFRKLLRNIPENSGMAYVLVQHLSPAHESLLPELLSRETKLPVHEITDDINLAPDHIYIIPENKMLTLVDGKLKLTDREAGKRNMVIDVFFESLAEVHGSFARAVILSGNGFDGTQGLKTIKEHGGMTFVQNPETSDYNSMPQNAIRSGAADFVLEIEEIPGKLQHVNQAYETSHAHSEDEPVPKTDEDIFMQILRLLRLRTGNDFAHYKQPTIRRRIARRMVVTKREEPGAYLSYLRNNKEEQDALFNDILIPVSYFFRDDKIFTALAETAFPRILEKKKSADDSIRVWVAGCSTGEEAYSIAILLHEFVADKMPDIKIQVFASDISENVISKARTAIYTKQEVQNVSDARLSAYFVKIDGAYHVKKKIREMCVFAAHNFVKDPPFAKMDLISCRNVLIYLDPFLQKKALTTFHYALRPHGVLFLGKSESATQVNNLFDVLVKHQKIYSKKVATTVFVPSFERSEAMPYDRNNASRKKLSLEPDFQKVASEILFSRYTPAGVIINEHKEIVHFHGDTSHFLRPSPGKPNFNIYKMIRDGLAFELRNALLKTKNSKEPVIKENIAVGDKEYLVNIEVIPLDSTEPHYLVLFHKNMIPLDEKKRAIQRKNADIERIKQLEEEIAQMREDIRRVTEDQEAANEELQSANEELLSNSEELQTLNEELETSAEELQSNNEELITVNDELMDRQEQLMAARLYSEAIIETIREPLIVLDRDMRIKSANASFYRFFRVTEQDVEGRLLFDISSGEWNNNGLREQIKNVLDQRVKLEDFEITLNLPDLGPRTMLLNVRHIKNDNHSEQLVLLAIEDITEVRVANAQLVANNRELEESNSELSSFSYIASHDLQEPLRKIHTFSKLIIDTEGEKLSDKSQMYLDRIMVSTLRMQQLIDDLLNYSRITSVQEEHFETIDVVYLIEDVKNELKEIAAEKQAAIKVQKIPPLRIIKPLMYQLFFNIIGNALKYTRPGVPPVIKVTSGIVSGEEIAFLGGVAGNHYCRISIADNGIGFAPGQENLIFEPFKRLHSKDKYEGTGIGLAICKKIATKHHGFINAEGKPGEGSVFNIYLPV